MDKNTLSNYGWIVIAVLVLSVMIALATPFGGYIKKATISTVEGLFATEEKALNVMGLSALGDGNGKVQLPSESETIAYETLGNFEHKAPNGAIESHDTEEGICSKCGETVLAPGMYTKDNVLIYTWQQLLDDEYVVYDESTGLYAYLLTENEYNNENYYLWKLVIPHSITTIEPGAFLNCANLVSFIAPNNISNIPNEIFKECENMTSIIIPDSVISIGRRAFSGCTNLSSVTINNAVESFGMFAFQNCSNLHTIIYKGTAEQWNSIQFGTSWNINCPEITIHCTDGDITIPAWSE